MDFDRLLPNPRTAPLTELLTGARGMAASTPDRPRLLINMVSTVDGAAAIGGRSGPIGGEGDTELFGELRTLTDAILVGTGTLRAERYGRLVRSAERRARRTAAGLAADPLLILFSRQLDLPWDAPVFAAPEQRIVICCDDRAGGAPPTGTQAQVELLRVGTDPSVGDALRAVRRAHGIDSVLCEGGPTLNARLLAEGAVDELFVTVGPLLAGDPEALGILAGPTLPAPARLTLTWVLRQGDELYLRYAVAAE